MNNDLVGIVYNNCYGGFDLSDEAILRYGYLKEWTALKEKSKFGVNVSFPMYPNFYHGDIERNDPILVKVVQEQHQANKLKDLSIMWLKKGTAYYIDEYDGNESVIVSDQRINIA